mgnify:CR=1 FL=1
MVEQAPVWIEEIFPDQLAIKRYVDILVSRGIDWGLIGPREPARIWTRHVINSVSIAGLMAANSRVCDVGSGAGLPGIPLAIARPDLQITLVESLLRRSEFLSLAVDELGLAERVTVVRSRAEDLKGSFDIVTARAVAALPKLVTWTTPLFMPDGELVALKGESAEDELALAQPVLSPFGLTGEVLFIQAHAKAEPTYAIRVRSS